MPTERENKVTVAKIEATANKIMDELYMGEEDLTWDEELEKMRLRSKALGLKNYVPHRDDVSFLNDEFADFMKGRR